MGKAVLSWLVVPTLYTLLSLALIPTGYILFHFSIETACVVVGVLCLLTSTLARHFVASSLLLVVGSGLGWVALVDFAHSIAFEGMELLPGDSANLATQLWVSGRVLLVAVLLAGILLQQRAVRLLHVHLVCAGFVLLVGLLLWSGAFPVAFETGRGLTPFKVATEYLVMLVLVLVALLVQRQRQSLPLRSHPGLLLALASTLLSEFCFTLYGSVSDGFNAAGHVLKLFAYWFLFRALVEDSLLLPFRQREALLRQLGERVKELHSITALARVSQEHEGDVPRVLAAMVDILPAAMQYPEAARVSVVSRYGNFGVAPDVLDDTRSIARRLLRDGIDVGMLKVGYPPDASLQPPVLLDEEQALMDVVASRLGALLGREHSQATIRQLNRLYRMLSGINRAIVHSSSRGALLWELFNILRDSHGFGVVVVLERTTVAEPFTLQYLYGMEAPVALADELQQLAAGRWQAAGQQPDEALVAPQPLRLHTSGLAQPGLRKALQAAGSAQLVLVPVVVQQDVLALVAIGAVAGSEFDADQLQLLAELGSDMGFALTQLRQGQRLLEAEDRVVESEQRYEVLFQQSPVPMTLLDAGAQQILAHNRAYAQWLGSPLCEITDVQDWFARVIAEPGRIEPLKAQLAENIGKSFAPFGYFQFPETRILHSSGRVLMATARLTVVRDRILVAFNDITQLKQNEARLRDSEARFRNMIEETLFGVMVVQDGRFVYVNPAFQRLTGWQAGDLIGSPLDTRARLLTAAEIGVPAPENMGDVAQQRVYACRRADGTQVNLYASVGFMPWDEKPAEVMIVQDVTERLRYERQLRDSAELLDNLAQQVPGVVYQFRLYPDGRSCFPFATRSIEDIYEVTGAEVKEDATAVYQRLHPDDLAQVRESIGASARELSVWKDDFRVILPRQGLRWRSGFARPQRLPDGSVLWHGFIEDSTERKQRDEELRQTNARLLRSVSATLDIISRIMDHRDPYTSGHQRRVGQIARLLAAGLDLDQDTQELLELAGMVHDVGKIAVPAEILTKPMKLSDIEYRIVMGHAEAGYAILQGTNLPQRLVEAVHQHHERLDGSGYPQGLQGEQICLEARIIAVADVFESMTSHRPFRAALTQEQVLGELQKLRGTQLDANVVDVMVRLLQEGRVPPGSGAG